MVRRKKERGGKGVGGGGATRRGRDGIVLSIECSAPFFVEMFCSGSGRTCYMTERQLHCAALCLALCDKAQNPEAVTRLD